MRKQAAHDFVELHLDFDNDAHFATRVKMIISSYDAMFYAKKNAQMA